MNTPPSKPNKWRYLLKSKIEDKEHALFVHQSCLVFIYITAAVQVMVGLLAIFVMKEAEMVATSGILRGVIFAGIAYHTQKYKSMTGPVILTIIMIIDLGQSLLANAQLIDVPESKIGLLKVALLLTGLCWIYALHKYKQFDKGSV